MIAIIDYRAGNLTSVARALDYIKEPYRITADEKILTEADRIIFPGVGAAGDAMENLKRNRLDRLLPRLVDEGKPVLGICLGTQVIYEYSEENNTKCLGIVPGVVKKFPDDLHDQSRLLKIPHMGWNAVTFEKKHPVFKGLPEEAEFYFVHSYYPAPSDDRWIIGRTDYGIRFCSAVAMNNLVAVQFHPEKSGRPGLQLLANFCRWRRKNAE